MADNPPISFEAKAKQGGDPKLGGYPYQLKGSDLDKCFVWATEQFDDQQFEIEEVTGQGGHRARKIKLLAAFPKGTTAGQLLYWAGEHWQAGLLGTEEGQTLTWTGSAWTVSQQLPPKPTTGTYVLGCVDGALSWIATESC